MLRRAVWKFELPMVVEGGVAKWEKRFTIKMPASADILTVQVQGGKPCIWAKVDPENIPQDQGFMLIGTGHPLPQMPTDLVNYVGTFQLESGGLVFHLFRFDDCPF